MLRFLLFVGLLITAGTASAEPGAASADHGRSRAERSFGDFAETWMQKVRGLEEQHRAEPDVKLGSTAPVVTYRGYGDDYSTELRPTGYPAAPYVGLLRYTEHVYSCTSMTADECRVAASVPVTEIFRYQNGRWSY